MVSRSFKSFAVGALAAAGTLAAGILLLQGRGMAHAQTGPAPIPEKLLVDTDIGDDIDDAFAMALVLRSPQFQLLGVTTATGDTALRAHLVLRLLGDAGRSGIPVAAGVPTPPATPFTQAAYARGDHHTLRSGSAVNLILDQARRYPGEVTLLALGPLTNVGAAIEQDPAGFRKLRKVVMMGGSIHRGYDGPDGSPNRTPDAEWNVKNDPAGAQRLLSSGVPVFMLPLDSTQVALPAALKQEILGGADPLDRALAELLREFNREEPILFDPVAAASAEDPAVCPMQPMHLEVTRDGFTRQTPGPANAEVCLHVNRAAFLRLLTDRLTGSTPQH